MSTSIYIWQVGVHTLQEQAFLVSILFSLHLLNPGKMKSLSMIYWIVHASINVLHDLLESIRPAQDIEGDSVHGWRQCEGNACLKWYAYPACYT